MIKFGILISALTIILIGGLLFVSNKSQNTGELQGEYIEELSRNHIEPGQEHLPYNSNPPSSGPHFGTPQPAGIYDSQVADGAVIHSLEHGGVWVTYKPDLAADQIDALKNIVRKNRAKVILSPRTANDSNIALVSWTRVLKLGSIDENVIKQFIVANRDHAPETIPL